MSGLTLLLFIIPVLHAATELPAWHMKPLGSHVPPDAVDETFPETMISPDDFANNYVKPRKPIVFRNVVKNWPAYEKWTDDYLTEKYGKMELRLEAKREKQGRIPKGDICLGRDTMKKFIQDYRQGADKYVVSELPTPMWGEVNVPPPMSCGDFLTNYVEIDLWINSDLGKKGNGGSSILHKDAFNTVNCVVNGSKEWKLIELKYNDYVYQSWEGPLDAGYGGFSLINTEKVNAKKFPNVGKIPNWQFTTITAGDCLYLPSQMWHQVKSYGETNKAVAFLFSQFNEVKTINTSSCKGSNDNLRLSDVDVDLQYPGHGPMSMGYDGIEPQREMLMEAVDRSGKITPKSLYRAVYQGHESGTTDKELMKEKTIKLYKHFLKAAGNDKTKLTEDLIAGLSRDEIRYTFGILQILDPNNALTHEYSALVPEEIKLQIEDAMKFYEGKLTKKVFQEVYENRLGGTKKFADEFWERLAGDKTELTDISKTIDAALRPYEKYRRDKPEDESTDEDTITTPQGHKSRPKKERGGYANPKEEEEEENEDRQEEGMKEDENSKEDDAFDETDGNDDSEKKNEKVINLEFPEVGDETEIGEEEAGNLVEDGASIKKEKDMKKGKDVKKGKDDKKDSNDDDDEFTGGDGDQDDQEEGDENEEGDEDEEGEEGDTPDETKVLQENFGEDGDWKDESWSTGGTKDEL